MPSNPQLNPDVWPYCIRPLAHIANLLECDPPIGDQRGGYILLLFRGALYLEARGYYEAAIDYLRRCRTIAAITPGEESSEYGGILNQLCNLLLLVEQLDEAAKVAESCRGSFFGDIFLTEAPGVPILFFRWMKGASTRPTEGGRIRLAIGETKGKFSKTGIVRHSQA